MKEKSNRLKWRKLDNSAKLFPITSSKKFSTVYRISAMLTKNIEPNFLKQALIEVLEEYTSFKVRLRKGFFWYYLEYNPAEPIVEPESEYPGKYIDPQTNSQFLFKVTYYEKKINIDVFHALTDGNSALDFLKAIIYRYIQLTHPDQFETKIQDEEMNPDITNTEDSYIKNYSRKWKGRSKNKKAYILKGRKLPLYSIGVTHQVIGLKQVIKNCRKRKVSVTMYFTALLIYSIYEANYKKRKSKKPIKICIPVNLKQYFDSTTVTNFFSYFTVQADLAKGKEKSFEEILSFVQQEFKQKLTKEKIGKTMSDNVKLGNHFFIRIMPLFLKKVTTKISYIEIRKYSTATLSNLGKINLLPEYQDYVETFFFSIAPEKGEKIKCSTCSYHSHISFTFTSILEDTDIEKVFKQKLEEENVMVQTKTNDRYEGYDKTYYPKIAKSIKRGRTLIASLLSGSVILGLVCLLLDFILPKAIHWSFLCIVGIVYCWITVMYSIRKNRNIAAHVMLQTIVISLLCFVIDWVIGYQGWSLNLALPIITMVANITILILYFINHARFMKYMIYQVIIFVFSMAPAIMQIMKITQSIVLISISSGIAITAFLIVGIFSGRQLKAEMERRFNL